MVPINYQLLLIQAGEDSYLKFKILHSSVSKSNTFISPSVPLKRILLNLFYATFLKRVLTGRYTNRMVKQYFTYFSFLVIKNYSYSFNKIPVNADFSYLSTLLLNSTCAILDNVD